MSGLTTGVMERLRGRGRMMMGHILHGRADTVLGVCAAGLTSTHVTGEHRTDILLECDRDRHLGHTQKTRDTQWYRPIY